MNLHNIELKLKILGNSSDILKTTSKILRIFLSEGVSDKCLGVSLVVQAIANYCVKNKIVKIKQFTILIRLLEVGVCINHSIQNMEVVKRGLDACFAWWK